MFQHSELQCRRQESDKKRRCDNHVVNDDNGDNGFSNRKKNALKV